MSKLVSLLPYSLSLSMYADVIFPLRLFSLTYKVPDGAPSDLTGRIVKAPLLNRSRFGLVVGMRDTADAASIKIKEIISIHDAFASGAYLQFLKWLSEYYLTPMGVALKSSFFDEAVADLSGATRKSRKRIPPGTCTGPSVDLTGIVSAALLAHVLKFIREDSYSSLLYHSPDIESEYSSLIEILKRISGHARGIIVLVPEAGFVEKIAPVLAGIFGDRFCILHSKLGKKERSESVKNILSGKSDVVLGTRSAVLAPLPHVSFIAVLEEHSRAYKGEEGLRYNARDLAVMRGYTERSCVLLSSICPSLESVLNARRGKYMQLNKMPLQSGDKRPFVRIAAFKTRKQSELSLSSEVISMAGNLLREKKQLLFFAGRKGYSLIRCEECGHVESCVKCSIPMVFYKSTGMLKCHHCGYESRNPESCGDCGGPNLKPLSAGTERVMQDVKELLKSPCLLVEKAKVSSASKTDLGPNKPDLSDFVPFVIGTSAAKRKICGGEKYSAAVLMNFDLLLAQPDFRAYERAFQEIIEVSQMVKPGGSLFIQTKSPGSKVLKCARHYDFEAFQDLELSQRKDLDYPPYSRMVLFTVFVKGKEPLSPDIWRMVRDIKSEAVAVLGPIEAPSASKSYVQCHRILMKSKDSRKLHEMAKTLLLKIGADKRLKVVVDVDPIKI